MLIRKAYKFRLKPSALQAELMAHFAGQARFLWNKALALNLERLQQKQKILYYPELNFWTTLWKKSDEYAFLRQCPAHVLQQKLRDLDRAFKDAFDKKQPNKRLPRFKKKGLGDSFRFPAPEQVRLVHRHITFPKLGKMRFFNSRAVEGKIRNYTISRRGAHWYVSIQVECLVDTTLHAHRNKQAIGLDMGIKHFVTTSDGEQIAPINSFRQLSEKLARSQRKASKKQKFSSNWKKAMQRVAKVHQRIADQRRDFQHKLSTQLCKNHALIIVEALKIKNMSRSASGTREEPGRCVSAKSGLNKSILDQGWFEFKRQLDYKSAWRGGLLLEVPAQYTSQRCSHCDYQDADNRKTQEQFVCLQCHQAMNADVNAARNILAAGHAVLACGASA